MNNINLNIKSIRDNIQNTRDTINDFSDTTNKYLSMLTNVDTCWNDNLTPSFIKTVYKDQEHFNELVESINHQVTLSSDFCDEMQRVIEKKLDIPILYNIKYINSTTEKSIDVLDIINEKIASIKSSISSLSIPYSSSNRSVVRDLLNDVNTDVIENTKQEINDTITSINSLIENFRSIAQTSSKYELDGNTIKLISKIFTPNLSKTNPINEESYRLMSSATISNMSSAKISVYSDDYNYNNKVLGTNLEKTGDLDTDSKISFKRKTVGAMPKDSDISDIEANDYSAKNKSVKGIFNDINPSIKQKEYSYNSNSVVADLEKPVILTEQNDYSYKNPTKAELKNNNSLVNHNNYSYEENIIKPKFAVDNISTIEPANINNYKEEI